VDKHIKIKPVSKTNWADFETIIFKPVTLHSKALQHFNPDFSRTTIKKISLDGGFVDNLIFINMLSEKLNDCSFSCLHSHAAWSGWQHYNNVQQNIYIAELENPWTMKGDRVLISKPTLPWELHGKVPLEWQKNTGEPPYLKINEGPQFLTRNGRLFIIYSANACWLDYNLGMLQYKGSGSLLDAKNWIKYPKPVFKQAPENGVYAPGHNSFFKSPDGKEDWIIYHANPGPNDGCGAKRAPHMQKFSWNKDGTPNFGKPVPKVPLPAPSGSY
jgi:GH43 family beta-xylosidase